MYGEWEMELTKDIYEDQRCGEHAEAGGHEHIVVPVFLICDFV